MQISKEEKFERWFYEKHIVSEALSCKSAQKYHSYGTTVLHLIEEKASGVYP